MDRLIYTAMTGASQALEQQAVTANNLANASTTGFKAQLAAFRQVPMSFENQSADGMTRTFVLSSTPNADYSAGPIIRSMWRSRAPAGCPCRRRTAAKPTRARGTCTWIRTASS